MFKYIFILFVLIPALEIWLFLTLGSWVGIWKTFLLIIVTGFIGAILVKRESKKAMELARYQWANGQIPGQSILDGVCIFAGGLFLLTPGFFTDTLGALLVLPFTRPLFRMWLLAWIQRKMQDGSVQFFGRW